MMAPMATTMVLARARANETGLFGRVRFSRGRRLPDVDLPEAVATSVQRKRSIPIRPSGPPPPRPLTREERDLANLLSEILPDDS